MKPRIVRLVGATTSLVLVAFLVPLAVLIRSAAADRALSAAFVELETLVPVVATAEHEDLPAVVDRANAGRRHPVTVFLPDGRTLGPPAGRTRAVTLAAAGQSLTGPADGGQEVLVAVAGLSGGTAVLRTFVPAAELRQGVARAWSVLGALGLVLLAVGLLVAYQLARTITAPLTVVAATSRELAGGRLDARAPDAGPPEVRQVGAGLNLLASRIGELLAAERERVADLSHQIRTPLTALRIDAESLRDPAERSRIALDLDRVERTVDAIIRQARRPVAHDVVAVCDAAEVITERARFWWALAEEERRDMRVWVSTRPVAVGLDRADLAAAADALLGNVFTHTPEGCGMQLWLEQRHGGGAVLAVADEGPGMPPAAARRGHSGAGSTGLGLDIVRRAAASSGGSMRIDRAPAGGALVVVELGAPAASSAGRQRRTRSHRSHRR